MLVVGRDFLDSGFRRNDGLGGWVVGPAYAPAGRSPLRPGSGQAQDERPAWLGAGERGCRAQDQRPTRHSGPRAGIQSGWQAWTLDSSSQAPRNDRGWGVAHPFKTTPGCPPALRFPSGRTASLVGPANAAKTARPRATPSFRPPSRNPEWLAGMDFRFLVAGSSE